MRISFSCDSWKIRNLLCYFYLYIFLNSLLYLIMTKYIYEIAKVIFATS